MNSFGSSAKQYPLYDPLTVRENRERFGREPVPYLDCANSLYIPTGRWSTRGWILLRRSDYDLIDKYSAALQLQIGDPNKTDNIGTLKNLSIVQAQCVTRGLSSAKNAIYLVELTDVRGILQNQWFQYPLTAAYNIRSPAHAQTFQLGSMKDYPTAGPYSKTTWTWATMIQDIWERINTPTNFLGIWPGLPITPTGTPEGWWFQGVPAWNALNDVLKHIGLTIACDLTLANPFTIIQPGNADTAFTNLQTTYKTNLEDDMEWVDTGSGRVPGTVVVLFRRRNFVYGSEETVTYRSGSMNLAMDNLHPEWDMAQQWNMNAVYSVSVSAPSTFTGATGRHFIWDDFTVRYDHDSNPITADTTVASQIAQERVTQYFANIYRQTKGFMTQVYAGALPFKTGSLVDGVGWRMNRRNGARKGWETKVVRGKCPPWDNMW